MTILEEGEAIGCDWFKCVDMDTASKASTMRGSEQQMDAENVFKVFAAASHGFLRHHPFTTN